MSKRYRKGAAQDVAVLSRVLSSHHRDLKNAKIRVALIMIDPKLDTTGEPLGPAMVVGGDPAVARVRIASPIDRLLGGYDVRIDVDGFIWGLASEGRKLALLDHELCHLCLDRDSQGQIVPNDDSTARLVRRGHDWALTGFAEVVERHGNDAVEVFGLKALHDEHGQLLFGFLSSEAGEDAVRLAPGKRSNRGKRKAG